MGLGILAEHVYTGYLVPLYACSQGSTGLSLRCTSQVPGLELDLNVQPTNLRGSTFWKFRYTIPIIELFHLAFVYFLFKMKHTKLLQGQFCLQSEFQDI